MQHLGKGRSYHGHTEQKFKERKGVSHGVRGPELKKPERIPMTEKFRKGFRWRIPEARALEAKMEREFPKKHGRESTKEEFKALGRKARREIRRKDQLFN